MIWVFKGIENMLLQGIQRRKAVSCFKKTGRYPGYFIYFGIDNTWISSCLPSFIPWAQPFYIEPEIPKTM